MKHRIYKAIRVSDGQVVEYTRMIPETDDDLAELERLEQQGQLGAGDSFAEQAEHQRVAERRERRPAS